MILDEFYLGICILYSIIHNLYYFNAVWSESIPFECNIYICIYIHVLYLYIIYYGICFTTDNIYTILYMPRSYYALYFSDIFSERGLPVRIKTVVFYTALTVPAERPPTSSQNEMPITRILYKCIHIIYTYL